MTLLTGTLLAQGRRTVAAALRASGNDQGPNWSGFHQVLNRARWSPLAVSRQLLLLIVATFVPAGACVYLVIDETLERRWGGKISKRGHYRDSALSRRERSVSSPGLRWIVMAVVVTLPWTKQRWALPFLCVLATTPEVSERLGKRHKTVGMWAHQMLSLVRSFLPDRSIKLMGDTAYTVLELGRHAQAQQVTLITTGRLDAVLHEPPEDADPTHHWSSPCRWSTTACSGDSAPGLRNRLAETHPGLVGARGANPGDRYWHRAVVSLWIRSLAYSLGADS